MATKRQRGGVWHYVVKRAKLLPQPIYLSFDNEAEGDTYVKRLEALLDRGVVPDEYREPAKVAKQDLRSNVRRYLAAQHVTDDDRKLLATVQDRLPPRFELVSITFPWASAWVTSLKREQNLSPSTVRKHVGALARALDWLAADGAVPVNPLRLLPKGYATYTPEDRKAVKANHGAVKEDTERDRRLEKGEEPEIRRLLAGGKPKGRQRALELHEREALVLLFDMALESAMRLREMFTLQAGQVDLAKRTIFLEKTKNGSKRQVPITTVLGKLLRTHLKGMGPDDRVFPWWDGDPDPVVVKRASSLLSRQFARLFDAAGCVDLHFHDLRHEATSRIFERTDLSEMEIAKITGHKDMRTLARYANLRGSKLATRLW